MPAAGPQIRRHALKSEASRESTSIASGEARHLAKLVFRKLLTIEAARQLIAITPHELRTISTIVPADSVARIVAFRKEVAQLFDEIIREAKR